MTNKIKGFARSKGLKVCQYSIKEVEKSFIKGGKLSKRNLTEEMVEMCPELYFRIFEAAALTANYVQIR